MNADTPEQGALFRLHRRACFMKGEEKTGLFNAAVQSGDIEARQLAMNVIAALKMLTDYTDGVLYPPSEEQS